MNNKEEKMYLPYSITLTLNVLAWLAYFLIPLETSVTQAIFMAVVCACITFIPSTLLFGMISSFISGFTKVHK